jgi:hypothetical protein
MPSKNGRPAAEETRGCAMTTNPIEIAQDMGDDLLAIQHLCGALLMMASDLEETEGCALRCIAGLIGQHSTAVEGRRDRLLDALACRFCIRA